MKVKQAGMIYTGVAGMSALTGAALTSPYISATDPDPDLDDFAPYVPKTEDCIAAAMAETFSLSPEKQITKMPDGSVKGEFSSDAFTARTFVARKDYGAVTLVSLETTFNNTPIGPMTSGYQIDFSSGHGWVAHTQNADPGRDDSTLNLLLLMNGSLKRCAYDMK